MFRLYLTGIKCISTTLSGVRLYKPYILYICLSKYHANYTNF